MDSGTDEVATGLEPLDDNLVRVWHFDNTTKEWSFYDSRPEFADFNTVTVLEDGEIYVVQVLQDQTVTLNETERNLTTGWNIVAW